MRRRRPSPPAARALSVACALACLLACGGSPPPVAVTVTPLPQPAPPPPAPTGPRAEVRVLTAADPLVEAGVGQPGDLALVGALTLALVAGPAHQGPGGGGGHLVAVGPPDAGPALADFGALVPTVDAEGLRPVRAQKIEITERAGPAALVLVEGHPLDDPDLKVQIEYRVDARAPGLQIQVRLENRSAGRHPGIGPSWWLRWGELEPVVPGLGIAPLAQRASAEWLAADSERLAVAIGRRGGLFSAAHGPGWTVAAPSRTGLEPHGSVEDSLRIHATTAATAPTALGQLLGTGGLVHHTWAGRVEDPRGQAVAGAQVLLADREGRARARARTDAAGAFALSAPPGEGLTLQAQALGRAAQPPRPRPPGDEVRLEVGAAGQIDLTVVDAADQPVSARITFTGPVVRAPIDHRGGPLRVALQPGEWRLDVAPGPDRRQASAQVTITEGAVIPVRLRLPAVWDRAGWRAVDAYAPGGQRLHADACAAHGIDAAIVPGEPGLGGLSSHRLELDDRGRFVAWPAEPGRSRRTGRAGALLAEARRARPRAVIALLGPRSPGAGYLQRFGFEPGRPLPAGGFALAFDALEIAAPGVDRRRAMADWFDLLWRGVKVAPLGGSGGDPAQRCGALRTWIGAPGPWRHALQTGPVCVSGGPLIVLERRGPGQVRVTVRAAPRHWPKRLRLWGDGRELQRLALPETDVYQTSRDLAVPAGVRWAVVEADDPAAAADDWRRWAITGAVRLED